MERNRVDQLNQPQILETVNGTDYQQPTEATTPIMFSKTHETVYFTLKRIIDVIGSIIGLIPFGLVYLVLFIPYHSGDNKGPMLFKQHRLGKNGKEFYIYKFRSMRVNADEYLHADKELYQKYIENGYKLTPEEDPRITSLGRFLRKSSLDELPQFVNVIKGEMSLVGPRPIVPEELRQYGDKADLFLKMKPGVTGVWQTSGRSGVNYPERVDLELSYLDHESIWFDFSILAKTFIKVFKHEGAY